MMGDEGLMLIVFLHVYRSKVNVWFRATRSKHVDKRQSNLKKF